MSQTNRDPDRDRVAGRTTNRAGSGRRHSQRLNHRVRSDQEERFYPSDRRDPSQPAIYMPGMPPLKLIAALRRHVLAWRNRRWIRQLLRYDDHLLDDLGFDRPTLSWALQLPPTMDAVEALRDRASADRSKRRCASIHDIR